MQRNYASPGPVGKAFIRVELFSGRLVQAVQRRHRAGVAIEFLCVPSRFSVLVDVLDEHAELCTPVTQVVRTDNIGAEKPEDTGQTVTDDGGP